MSLSIQSSAVALANLEALTPQSSATSAGASTSADPLLGASSNSNNASAIIDLSSGSASAVLNGLTGGLATSASIADAAATAGSSIQDILTQLQQDATTASDSSTDSTARTALNADFHKGLAQIQSLISSASVGGVNLIDGSVAGQVPVAQAAGVSLTGTNLSLGGPLIGVAADASLSDPAAAASLAEQLGTALDNVGQALGQISAQGTSIASHLSVVAQAGISLSGGASVDPSLDADGARLSALQLQQQLSASPGAIANQSPAGILSLFR